MKKKLKYTFIILGLLSISVTAQTVENNLPKDRWKGIEDHTPGILQSFLVGVEYRIKAGIALGGTAPLPIPLEIQKVNGFNPLINTSLEAEIVKVFQNTYGLSFGLRLETKGMETDAEVKNYNMKMVTADSEIAGVWTGMVKTQVVNSYITLPVLGLWKPSPRWDMKLGLYASYALSRSFSGSVYDGYLREGSPVGEKIEIENAIYDFSEDIRRWNWGLQLGADWRAFPHLLVGLDLTWGLNSILKKSFDTITFDMYPIYLDLNFGYAF